MSFGLAEGSLFAGRYRVGHVIGVGGMGAVYEVVHVETDRAHALKVMLPNLFWNDTLRARFKREAKVAACVQSEFIVDVFDAGVDEETQLPFLVMELLRGEDLERRVQRLGPLTPMEAATCLYQAALALDKTHKAAIVHRDLKPENLFLTQRDDELPRIKVLDFGIAKLVSPASWGDPGTQRVGTPQFMAPEQLDEEPVLSSATDIYSLAMVSYSLLVGAPYWAEEDAAGEILTLLNAVSVGPLVAASVRARARGVYLPPAYDAWFAKATAKSPADRFQVATAAVRALVEALDLTWQWERWTAAAGVPSPSAPPPPPHSPSAPPPGYGPSGTSLLPAASPPRDSTAGAEPSMKHSLLAIGAAMSLGLGAILGGAYASRVNRSHAATQTSSAIAVAAQASAPAATVNGAATEPPRAAAMAEPANAAAMAEPANAAAMAEPANAAAMAEPANAAAMAKPATAPLASAARPLAPASRSARTAPLSTAPGANSAKPRGAEQRQRLVTFTRE